MTRFGYTLMTEQSGPKQLVDYAVSAERAGFDLEVSIVNYSPWLSAQGHAPHAWTVLGAVAHATERVELFTYVTCPTMRYHPAVVAQQAATLQILADGRFTLGVGSGENLNEHVVGQGWPTIKRRQDMLREAVQIIRELFTGEVVDWKGDYFEVDSARLWDLPEVPVAIAAAVVVVIVAPVARRILSALRDRPELRLPVALYIVVISAMLATALATGNVLAAVGAVLFVGSDAMIAWNRFVRPFRAADLGIMVTYHLGQAGLVLSLVH